MNSTSRVTSTCALAVLLTAAPGCKSNDDTGGELRANIGIDLTSVAGFVVTQGAATGTSGAALHAEGAGGAGGGSAASQLYALNADGTLTVVTVTQGGTSSTSVTPLAVFGTRTFVIMAYDGVTYGADPCNFVAARTADGALYCVTVSNAGFAPSAQGNAEYGALLQSDATGNIVWINHNDGVTVLDLTDPTNPTQQTPAGNDDLSPNGPPAGPFSLAVNDAGDALISSWAAQGQYTRVFFPAGGFFDVSSTDADCLVSGPPASPDDFYYTTDAPQALVKLAAGSGTTFTETTLSTTVAPFCSAGVVKVGAQIFLTGDPQSSDANVLVDLAADVPTALTVGALATVTQVGGCDASLFALGTDASGNGGIVRYDLASGAFTTLLAPGAYALTTMAVSPGCEVTFYGQRAADGAYVLGNVAAGSDTVTVDATGFPAVSQIARIN